MSGLDVIAIQDSIGAYVRAQFPGYVVYDDVVLDEQFVLKQGNKVKPYIVLEWGGLRDAGTDSSFVSVRYDQYYSTVDVTLIAPTPNQARRGLNIVRDKMLGWKPAGSTPLATEGGMDVLGIPDRDGSPMVYLAGCRFRYNINVENVGAHIAP